MVFQYAASGNTAALQAWLRQYPERVNVQSPNTHYTLLHTAVKNRHLATVQMLIEEFNADLEIPCGGIGNTCLHVAASNGDFDMLSLLLSYSPMLKPNQFSEYPIDVAMWPSDNQTKRAQCASMLRAYEQQQKQQQRVGGQTRQIPTTCSTNISSSSFSEAPLREVIRGLAISSDNEDNDKRGKSSCPQPKQQQQQLLSSSSQVVKASSLTSANTVEYGHKNKNLRDISGSSMNMMMRNERRINEQTRLPLDLKIFRHTYGNGFEFIEGSSVYWVRGLLPYNFKNNVYYTPVILVLQKLTDMRKQQGKEKEKQQESFLLRSNTDKTNRTLSTYRAIIDRTRLGNLSISRRATYIDPCSGVIIPSRIDIYYKNILDFVRYVILDNFERIPPLTYSKDLNNIVKDNIPLFKLYPNEHEITLRILRDISIFYDGAFIYDNTTRQVKGFIPLFCHTLSKKRTGNDDGDDHCVFMDDINFTSSLNTVNSKNIVYNNTIYQKNENMLMSQLVMKLPCCVQFISYNNFENPPHIYFPNATTNTHETRMNYAFLSSLIMDSSNGEINHTALNALQNWTQHGSLLTVLSELQEKATLLLTQYCKSSISTHIGHMSTNSLSLETHGPIHEATLSHGRCLASNNPLPSTTAVVSKTLWTNVKDMDMSTMCVVCIEAVRNFVLLPCRHLVLCRQCSLHYRDRLADRMLCPICRTVIEDILEVFS